MVFHLHIETRCKLCNCSRSKRLTQIMTMIAMNILHADFTCFTNIIHYRISYSTKLSEPMHQV